MASLLDINGISHNETAKGEGNNHGEDIGGLVAIHQTSHLNVGTEFEDFDTLFPTEF